MTQQTFLQGKVAAWTLPQVQPGPDTGLSLKRLMLPQGELAQFHDADEPIRYIASIELKTGTVRGNHYHKLKREYVYLLSGNGLFVFEDLDTGNRRDLEFGAGTLVLITPKVAHALDVKASGFAVEFSPNRFDPEDTYRHKLV